MKAVFVYVLILAGIMLSGCASTPDEPDKNAAFHKQLGIAHLNEGKNQLAFVEFQKALNIDAKDAEVLYYLGMVYLSFEDIDNSVAAFRRAVSVNPGYSEAYNSMGVAYLKAKRYPDAIQALKSAIANPLYKTPEYALHNLGTAYYRLGKTDDALSAFKTALRRNPDYITPYLGIALAYNRTGQFSEASKALERAMELDPAVKGEREKLVEAFRLRVITAQGDEEQDLRDLLEILNY